MSKSLPYTTRVIDKTIKSVIFTYFLGKPYMFIKRIDLKMRNECIELETEDRL